MTNQVSTNLTFEQKMIKHAKEGIGDLINDDEMAKIVSRAMEEIFFKPREGRDRWDMKVPLAHEMVSGLLNDRVRDAVNAWVVGNEDKIAPLIDQILKDGIAGAVMSAINQKTAADMHTLAQGVLNSLGLDRQLNVNVY